LHATKIFLTLITFRTFQLISFPFFKRFHSRKFPYGWLCQFKGYHLQNNRKWK